MNLKLNTNSQNSGLKTSSRTRHVVWHIPFVDGSAHGGLVFFAFDVYSGARSLAFAMSLLLSPYLLYVRS